MNNENTRHMKSVKNDGRGAMVRTAALILSLGLAILGCSTQGGAEATSSTSEAVVDPASLRDELPPGRDGSVFWSGRLLDGTSVIDIADNWARAAGRSTLEGRLLDLNVDAPWPEAPEGWWRTVSQLYADGARGNAFFIGGPDQRDDSVWNTVEFPHLRANRHVTCVYQVDPITFEETLIHGDPQNCNRPKTTDDPEWFVRIKEACSEWATSDVVLQMQLPTAVSEVQAIETNLKHCLDDSRLSCRGLDKLYGGAREIPGPYNTYVLGLDPDNENRTTHAEMQAYIDSHIRMFLTVDSLGVERAEVVDGGNHHLGYMALHEWNDPLEGLSATCTVIPEPGPNPLKRPPITPQ